MTQTTQTDGGAIGDTQEVVGLQRIQIWKDVSGGKSRGRCYGTGHLAVNLRPGVIHLTYEAEAAHIREHENQIVAAARAEAEAARAEAAAARADAEAARAEAAALRADVANG
ncbi:hypothetical protein TSUD_425430, partial [Trifolium subterraneum]